MCLEPLDPPDPLSIWHFLRLYCERKPFKLFYKAFYLCLAFICRLFLNGLSFLVCAQLWSFAFCAVIWLFPRISGNAIYIMKCCFMCAQMCEHQTHKNTWFLGVLGQVSEWRQRSFDKYLNRCRIQKHILMCFKYNAITRFLAHHKVFKMLIFVPT